MDPEFEKSEKNPANDPKVIAQLKGPGTKGKFPPKTSFGDFVVLKLKSGKRIAGNITDLDEKTGKDVIIEHKTGRRILVDSGRTKTEIGWRNVDPKASGEIDRTWRIGRAQRES